MYLVQHWHTVEHTFSDSARSSGVDSSCNALMAMRSGLPSFSGVASQNAAGMLSLLRGSLVAGSSAGAMPSDDKQIITTSKSPWFLNDPL